MLELEDVHTYYGESHVLQGISLSVPPGGVSVLLGRNGMGKTTTIRSIIGFTPPVRGSVRFQGREIRQLPPYQIARLGIGLVPQGRGVFPKLTVKENLLMASRKGVTGGWTLERVYKRFPRLKERASSLGGHLSGGEQQMLSIGRALLTNPRMLLLDEPSEGLSPIMVQEVAALVAELKAEGMSILMVEQNVAMALGVADQVYLISKGSVVFAGTPDELRENAEVKRQYLGITH